MTFLNVEFAPLNIPLERRLQTLAIFFVVLTQVGSAIIMPTITIYLIFYTRYWWLCLLYIIWYLTFDRNTPERGGRRSEWVRSWSWWVYATNYFPLKMVKVPGVELDKRRNYIFCYFPHGMLATGSFFTMATNAGGFSKLFPYHTQCIHALSIFYTLPFLRELSVRLGGRTATREAMDSVLSKPEGGYVSGLNVGGATEAYYCKPGVHKIVYKKRKGFIKIALRNGAPLVPVYTFGETDIYSQYEFKEGSIMNRLQKAIQRIMGFALIVPLGRGIFQYSFGMLPHRRPVTVVVGEPIDVQKTENPTPEQIDELHQKFEKEMIKLFESQKKYYIKDYENAHLEIR